MEGMVETAMAERSEKQKTPCCVGRNSEDVWNVYHNFEGYLETCADAGR